MQTFTKKEHIKKNHDYQQVFRNGKKIVKDHLIFHVMPVDSTQMINRIGIIVSKKVSKKSVVRNRVKRLLRESFRLNKESFAKGYDIVVVARKGIECLDFNDINMLLTQTLNHIGDTRRAIRNSLLNNITF